MRSNEPSAKLYAFLSETNPVNKMGKPDSRPASE